jgi:hypothetical protein
MMGFGQTARVAAGRRLTPVPARYTAAVDLDVECRCWRLELDTVTVSDRLKPDDLDLAFREVEAVSQPGSCKFGLGLRIENSRLTTTHDATGDGVPQDRQASEPGQYSRNINDKLGADAGRPQFLSVML